MSGGRLLLAMVGLNPWELALVAAAALLLFGSRLPALGRSVGRSIVEFKKGVRDAESDADAADDA